MVCDSLGGNVQDCCNLGMGETMKSRKLQHLAALGRKAFKGSLDCLAKPPRLQSVMWGFRRTLTFDNEGTETLPHLVSATEFGNVVASHSEEEGPDRACTIPALPLAPERQESLLGKVLGCVRVVDAGEAEANQVPPVPIDDELEGLGISVTKRPHCKSIGIGIMGPSAIHVNGGGLWNGVC